MDFYCIKCQKITNNATDVKLKCDIIDQINKLHSKCVECSFKSIATIDEEDLDYCLKELNIKKTALSFI